MGLNGWQKRKGEEIPNPDSASYTDCGAALEDGNFALVDGNLICLSCIRGLQEK